MDEEVIRQRLRTVGEDAVLGLPEVCIQNAQASDEYCHLGGRQGQQLRAIEQQFLGRQFLSAAEIVSEAIRCVLHYSEGVNVGLLLRSVRASRREGDLHRVPSFFRSFFDRCIAAENDQVRQRDFLTQVAVRLRAVERLLDRLQLGQNLAQFGGLIYFPILLWRKANASSVGSAALVGAAERRRRCPGSCDQLRDRQSGGEDLCLQSSNVLLLDQFMIPCGNRILPHQSLLRNERAQVTHDRTHVAVRQLEPRASERVCELIRMLVETPGNLFVSRIET